LRPDPWEGTDAQLKALESLRLRLQRNPPAVPPGAAVPPPVDDDTLRWYLRDRYFDVEEAESKLRSMLRWRREFVPQSITPARVSREMSTGKAYVHSSPDVYGRPVIVIRTRLHVVGEFPTDDSKRLCVKLIDDAISRLPPPNSAAAGSSSSSSAEFSGEQIVGIFDLRGFQVPRNADFVFAKFMVEAFFEYYPRRVGQVLFVEAPWVFNPAWQVIRPLMRKYAALVRFVSVDELRKEFFTPETLPADFK